jgi:hypothetical protein
MAFNWLFEERDDVFNHIRINDTEQAGSSTDAGEVAHDEEAKPYTVFIRSPEVEEVKVISIYANDKIDHLKGQIQCKTGIRPDLQRLMLNNTILHNGQMTATEAGITRDCVLNLLPPPLIGGGKRGRTSSSTMSKEDAITRLNEQLGRELLRINASAEQIQVVRELNIRLVRMTERLQAKEPVCHEILRDLAPLDLWNFQGKLSSSNGEHKMRAFSTTMWKREFARLAEVELVLNSVVNALHVMAESVLISGFANESTGNMSWEDLNKHLLQIAAGIGARSAQAAAVGSA